MSQPIKDLRSNRARYRPIARIVPLLGLLALGLLALTACSAPADLSEADQAAIYAAVIRRIYLQDDTFGGTLRPPVLYLVRATDDSVGDPDAERAASVRLSGAVQSQIDEALADLPTQITWVEDRAGVALDPTTDAVVGRGAIVTLGNIHSQDDGSVHVSGSIYVAMLAAGGQTYVLERVEGAWEVTGTTGIMWMS
jgi:hypothetical protein